MNIDRHRLRPSEHDSSTGYERHDHWQKSGANQIDATCSIEADSPEYESRRAAEVAGDITLSGFVQSDREDDRHVENRVHLSVLTEIHGRPARSRASFCQPARPTSHARRFS